MVERDEETSRRGDGERELLRELTRQMSRDAAPDVGQVVEWLGRRTGAEVGLLTGSGVVAAGTAGFPRRMPDWLARVFPRLALGDLATAAEQSGGLRVRCEAIGPRVPHPVLVVIDSSAPSEESRSLVSAACGVLAALHGTREAAAASRISRDRARQLRFAVLSALMEGQPFLARRMMAGAVPAVLDAAAVRVYLLRCGPADRDLISEAYQDHTGFHGPDLLVRCPVYNHHLICVLAEGANDAHGHRETLLRLVRENPGYTLGISGPHPLAATAEAYAQAANALAVARDRPTRVADYQGQSPLVHLLPEQEALAWARAFLRPLSSAPRLTINVTRLATDVPQAGIARLLGISRNTVRAHVRRAEEALGTGLNDVSSRAALALALGIAGPPLAAGGDVEQPAPTLEELFRAQPAVVWAEAFLSPLRDADHRGLDATLRAWIGANTDAQRAATRLGISRNTVRARVRSAERLLHRALLSDTGSGVHDLVHALRISQDTPVLTVA
ncbi:helix-turn-helix domain-containing protein [Streptomyces millisiae]|uniref:Helix-turn-helix domain-containing protein n=1 Tax=Streptomyces millisiae TaxID=3075542 RepID=A0ABU2LQC7_9ACTN|nr:helix-turn-helix domain-containing protein [Streptomyces sp. DSM 44918]MDT0319243.1 helix-turn-helix domain-containing protein [Streptomyces sp. DSM 44918]